VLSQALTRKPICLVVENSSQVSHQEYQPHRSQSICVDRSTLGLKTKPRLESIKGVISMSKICLKQQLTLQARAVEHSIEALSPNDLIKGCFFLSNLTRCRSRNKAELTGPSHRLAHAADPDTSWQERHHSSLRFRRCVRKCDEESRKVVQTSRL